MGVRRLEWAEGGSEIGEVSLEGFRGFSKNSVEFSAEEGSCSRSFCRSEVCAGVKEGDIVEEMAVGLWGRTESTATQLETLFLKRAWAGKLRMMGWVGPPVLLLYVMSP
jgi:hypothetical protein